MIASVNPSEHFPDLTMLKSRVSFPHAFSPENQNEPRLSNSPCTRLPSRYGKDSAPWTCISPRSSPSSAVAFNNELHQNLAQINYPKSASPATTSSHLDRQADLSPHSPTHATTVLLLASLAMDERAQSLPPLSYREVLLCSTSHPNALSPLTAAPAYINNRT